MSPEQIAKIVWERHIGEQATHSSLDILTTVIKEAIGLHEASKWKYPSKGELPEENKEVFYIFSGFKDINFGAYYHDRGFWDVDHKMYFSEKLISKWQYAPGEE